MKPGDRVVCIETHSQGAVKKGRVYTIMNAYNCQCGVRAFDVGLSTDSFEYKSSVCRCGRKATPFIVWWMGSSLFAPLQFNSAHDELTEIVEEKLDVELPVEV